jgi:hypothetical protein
MPSSSTSSRPRVPAAGPGSPAGGPRAHHERPPVQQRVLGVGVGTTRSGATSRSRSTGTPGARRPGATPPPSPVVAVGRVLPQGDEHRVRVHGRRGRQAPHQVERPPRPGRAASSARRSSTSSASDGTRPKPPGMAFTGWIDRPPITSMIRLPRRLSRRPTATASGWSWARAGPLGNPGSPAPPAGTGAGRGSRCSRRARAGPAASRSGGSSGPRTPSPSSGSTSAMGHGADGADAGYDL